MTRPASHPQLQRRARGRALVVFAAVLALAIGAAGVSPALVGALVGVVALLYQEDG